MKLPILFFLITIAFVNASMNFQRNIWVYWQTKFQQAPSIVKASYQKLSIAAEKANWTVILVNGTNLKNYLPDYEEFQNVVKNGVRASVQQKSDILRVALVAQNGGVWIDFSIVLYEDLSWLSNQESYKQLIINRYGSNINDPDMFMVGQGAHQSRLSDYNSEGVLEAEYFGYAIYFIAAKKNSKIMVDWKKNIYNLSQTYIRNYAARLNDERVYLHMIDRADGYYTGNVALDQTIQNKQFELDKNVGILSNRLSASQYYKIWAVHGQVGPCGLTRYHQFLLRDLFYKTKAQLAKQMGPLHFFLKMAKYVRDYVTKQHDKTVKYLQDKKTTFSQILKLPPSDETCKLSFMLQGSLLYILFENSAFRDQIKVPVITVQQRDMYEKHCRDYIPKYQKDLGWSHGQLTKPQRQLYQKSVKTFDDELQVFWKVNDFIFINTWQITQFVRIFITTLLVFCLIGQILISPFLKSGSISVESIVKKACDVVQIKAQSLITLALLVIRLGCVVLSFEFYYLVEEMGGFPQYTQTMVIVIIVILLDGVVQKGLQGNSQKRILGINLKQIYDGTMVAIYLPLVFVTLLHFQKVYILSFRYAAVIGGAGVVLFQIISQLRKRNKNDESLQFLMQIPRKIKYIWPGILVFLFVFQNFKYIIIGNTYIKQYFADAFYYGTYAAFIVVGIYLCKNLDKVLKQNPNQKQRVQRFVFLKVFITYIFVIVSMVLAWLAYSRLYSDPALIRHDYCAYSVMMHFTLLSIAIKNIFSQNLSQKYQLLQLVISFAFPVINMFYQNGYLLQTIDYVYWDLKKEQWYYNYGISMFLAIADSFRNQDEDVERVSVSYEQFQTLQMPHASTESYD